jgi:type II secretory pathway pseudopilin PulG
MIWRDETGFTLADLLVGMALMGLVLAAIVSIQESALRVYVMGSNTLEAQQNARIALERLSREIRETPTGVTVMAAISVTFTDQAGALVTWSRNGSELQRNGAVVIGGIQDLTFTYRDLANAVTATPANVRRVDVTIQTRTEENVPAGSMADARSLITSSIRLRNL